MANGVMMQDDAGNLYFLRPEILEAAKLPKAFREDAAVALKAAKGTVGPKLKVVGALSLSAVDVSGGQTTPTTELSAKAIKGIAIKPKVPRLDLDKVKSTVMCPW
jgi:hypothetical protein